jgi:hypothetical protein
MKKELKSATLVALLLLSLHGDIIYLLLPLDEEEKKV